MRHDRHLDARTGRALTQARRAPRDAQSRSTLPLVATVVALVTFAAFARVLDAGFVWDDDANLLQNPAYRGLGLTELRWMWTTTHLGHWMPLSWMSLGTDYLLWGMEPRGYHLTSLLIHVATAALLVAVAARLLAAARPHESPRTVAIAAGIAALLFAIHPLRVESVAWVTERRDVLSAFFGLLALWCCLRSADEAAREWLWLALAFAAFVAGLLSKAIVFVLPAIILLLEFYPLRRIGGGGTWRREEILGVARRLAPFALCSAASAALSVWALGEVEQLPVAGKVAVSSFSLAFYLIKTLVPVGLSPLYHMPLDVGPTEPRFLISYLVVATLVVAMLLLRRRSPGTVVAVLAFVVAVFPLLGLHQNGPQMAADRYTHHAAPALAILVAGGWLHLFARMRIVALGVATTFIVTLGALTWRQAGVWHDSISLWQRTVTTGTGGWIGQTNYANALVVAGGAAMAEEPLRDAIRLNPRYVEARSGLGVVLTQTGRLSEAEAELRHALALNPASDAAMANLGITLGQLGRHEEAIPWFAAALRRQPANHAAEANWGNALVRLRRPLEAIPHYERALQLDPGNPVVRGNLDVARRMSAAPPTGAPR